MLPVTAWKGEHWFYWLKFKPLPFQSTPHNSRLHLLWNKVSLSIKIPISAPRGKQQPVQDFSLTTSTRIVEWKSQSIGQQQQSCMTANSYGNVNFKMPITTCDGRSITKATSHYFSDILQSLFLKAEWVQLSWE